MTFDELQAEALKLGPKARASLAGKLLESLEALSDQENAELWAEEAARRDADLDSDPGSGRPADEVFRDARAEDGVTRRVTFHRFAEVELTDAVQFYELESSGLGASFLAEAERTIAFIVESPESGAAIRGSIRRRLLHRFPYGVLYTVRESEIRILAVMNLRRRPGYWVGRG